MIQLNVLSLLEQKGKSKYWLYKQMGMSYQNFNRMVTNQTKSIRLSNIETLCMLLECTPTTYSPSTGRKTETAATNRRLLHYDTE